MIFRIREIQPKVKRFQLYR